MSHALSEKLMKHSYAEYGALAEDLLEAAAELDRLNSKVWQLEKQLSVSDTPRIGDKNAKN